MAYNVPQHGSSKLMTIASWRCWASHVVNAFVWLNKRFLFVAFEKFAIAPLLLLLLLAVGQMAVTDYMLGLRS